MKSYWRSRLFGAIFLLGCLFALPNSADAQDTVILLHGMGRTAASMAIMKYRLEHAGFRVISESYPSTEGSVAEHCRWLEKLVERTKKNDESKIHFVTHSLGGIVLRAYLQRTPLPELGRVVMLAPPNQGSELADFLKEWSLYRKLTGPSGQQLGTGDKSLPHTLGTVNFEVGVIAGDVSTNPIVSCIIPGKDDGKVAVQRTKVKGMRDFLCVHHSHTFIMNSSRVARETIAFLKTGAFSHGVTGQPAQDITDY